MAESYSIAYTYHMFLGLPGRPERTRIPVQEIQVPSLGQEDSLEKEMATHSSILTWRSSWTEEPTVHGVTKSQTRLNTFAFTLERQPSASFMRSLAPTRPCDEWIIICPYLFSKFTLGLGLRCCVQALSSCSKQWQGPVGRVILVVAVVHRLLIVVASPVVEHRLWVFGLQ